MSISSLVGIGSNNLGPRFNLIGIIPSTLLIVFLFSLLFLWSEKPTTVPNLWTLIAKVISLDLTRGAILIILVIFLSLIIQPLQRPLVKLLEGYWGNSPLAERLTEIGIDIQRGKLRETRRLASPDSDRQVTPKQELRIAKKMYEADSKLTECYPKKENRLMPTTFGNILRAAEDLAGPRYGLATGAAWSRLYPLLSDNVKNIVNDQRNQLDLAVRFFFIFIIATIISIFFYFDILYNASQNDLPFYILLHSPSANFPLGVFQIWISLAIKYGSWLGIPTITSILSILFYRGAISAAMSYGTGLKVGFDLQRFELLKALHLQLPQNSEVEKIENSKLSDFLRDRKSGDFTYSHPN